MPLVLHCISPATIIPVYLAHWHRLAHGHHAIDKARPLSKRNRPSPDPVCIKAT